MGFLLHLTGFIQLVYLVIFPELLWQTLFDSICLHSVTTVYKFIELSEQRTAKIAMNLSLEFYSLISPQQCRLSFKPAPTEWGFSFLIVPQQNVCFQWAYAARWLPFCRGRVLSHKQACQQDNLLQSQTKLVGSDELCVKRPFLYVNCYLSLLMPPPPIAMLVAGKRHTCQLIYYIFISFQHCNGGRGDLNLKFPPKYKACHEFCPRSVTLGDLPVVIFVESKELNVQHVNLNCWSIGQEWKSILFRIEFL